MKKKVVSKEDTKRHRQLRILKAFGTFDFDEACDYKVERARQRYGTVTQKADSSRKRRASE